VGRVEKMTFTQPENRFREIRPGDDHFMMTDGIKLVPRASLEFSSDCPKKYIDIIARCYENGWIKTVAHVKTKELFWEVLEQ
jgi:hypothetical protein